MALSFFEKFCKYQYLILGNVLNVLITEAHMCTAANM